MATASAAFVLVSSNVGYGGATIGVIGPGGGGAVSTMGSGAVGGAGDALPPPPPPQAVNAVVSATRSEIRK
jgi:hypothetical protein